MLLRDFIITLIILSLYCIVHFTVTFISLASQLQVFYILYTKLTVIFSVFVIGVAILGLILKEYILILIWILKFFVFLEVALCDC